MTPQLQNQIVRLKLASENAGKFDKGDAEFNIGTTTQTRQQLRKPNLYRVFLLNDDYTPMDFVVYVLQTFFRKGKEEATKIMLNVHHTGMGECGVYTYEVAESKVNQVLDCARKNQHPLQCLIEKK